MSSFFGLNVALTALHANQYAIDVTGHNIANANTEGYRRQEAVFAANHPYLAKYGGTSTISQLGTGVVISAIRRPQTDFLDQQVRLENSLLGTWTTQSQSLQQVESMLAEPTDSGLSATLDRFWNAWQNLAASPDNLASRTAVAAAGVALSDQIRGLYGNMHILQENLDGQVAGKAGEINSLIQEIAKINSQTVQLPTGQDAPNDLLDKRDLLVEQLSKIVQIQASGSGADMIVSVGGHAIVQGSWSANVTTAKDSNGWTKLVWSDDSTDLQIMGGELRGLMDIRDSMLGGYLQTLDGMTRSIVEQVNALHVSGYDGNGGQGLPFFVPGTGAADIKVTKVISDAPILVVASGVNNAPGDNSIASSIAKLKTQAIVDGHTVSDVYSELVARIGSDSKEASIRSDAHEYTLDQRKSQREAVVGVSMDEEMANMLRFQQAYNAAARIFTVVDDMIDTIIRAV